MWHGHCLPCICSIGTAKHARLDFDIPEVKCLAFYSSLRVALDLDPLIQTGLVILNQVGCLLIRVCLENFTDSGPARSDPGV